MNDRSRTPWPLVALMLSLYVAYDLGASSPAPLLASSDGEVVSCQAEVTDTAGQSVYDVPLGMTFVLKDFIVSNTQANQVKNKQVPNVGVDIYPTLTDGMGNVKIAGTNLVEWPKGLNSSIWGGGKSGNKGKKQRSQAGFVGLSGGVVFEPGTSITVQNYSGSVFFSGCLVPAP